MRGKKAKGLRNTVRKAFAHLPVVSYSSKQVVKRELSHELNEDGTRKEVVRRKTTLFLQDCQREVYQGLKRLA